MGERGRSWRAVERWVAWGVGERAGGVIGRCGGGDEKGGWF